jgi:hypothetical protein
MAVAVSENKLPIQTSDHLESGPLKHELQKSDHVPAGHVPQSAEEKARSRAMNMKLDVYLLPFLSLLYLFNGLDRGNVGNAETQGTALSAA